MAMGSNRSAMYSSSNVAPPSAVAATPDVVAFQIRDDLQYDEYVVRLKQ